MGYSDAFALLAVTFYNPVNARVCLIKDDRVLRLATPFQLFKHGTGRAEPLGCLGLSGPNHGQPIAAQTGGKMGEILIRTDQEHRCALIRERALHRVHADQHVGCILAATGVDELKAGQPVPVRQKTNIAIGAEQVGVTVAAGQIEDGPSVRHGNILGIDKGREARRRRKAGRGQGAHGPSLGWQSGWIWGRRRSFSWRTRLAGECGARGGKEYLDQEEDGVGLGPVKLAT